MLQLTVSDTMMFVLVIFATLLAHCIHCRQEFIFGIIENGVLSEKLPEAVIYIHNPGSTSADVQVRSKLRSHPDDRYKVFNNEFQLHSLQMQARMLVALRKEKG